MNGQVHNSLRFGHCHYSAISISPWKTWFQPSSTSTTSNRYCSCSSEALGRIISRSHPLCRASDVVGVELYACFVAINFPVISVKSKQQQRVCVELLYTLVFSMQIFMIICPGFDGRHRPLVTTAAMATLQLELGLSCLDLVWQQPGAMWPPCVPLNRLAVTSCRHHVRQGNTVEIHHVSETSVENNRGRKIEWDQELREFSYPVL